MGYFKNICLLKAPQYFELPHPIVISDLTELCYLASMVKDEVNSVTIPADYYNKNIYEAFSTYLKNNPTDLVGISSLTGAFNNALRLAEIAKKNNKYVVMGGYHPSAMPDKVLSSPNIDAVIIGEGEETFKDLVINGPGKNIEGMAYKDNGGIVFTTPRPLIDNLDTIPHPLRHIRPARFGEKSKDYSVDTVFTSRGCPWNCSFCANDTIQKRWRARSPENVLEELSLMHHYKNKKYIKIWDANFLLDIKRVEKICDLMIERGLTNFLIWTEARVTDIIRAENIMDKLYRIGLRVVNLGIESPNEKTLKLLNKKKTSNDDAKATEILRRYKITPWGYFIIGHLEENKEDTKRYPEYAAELQIRESIFMIMTPYPGTSIFQEYQAENKIKSFDWDLYNNFCPVVETRDMDVHTLNKMYAYSYGRFVGKVHFSKFMRLGLLAMIKQMIASYSLMFYASFRINKTYSEEEIKDLIFELYQGATGIKFSRDFKNKKKKNLWLKLFKKITVRIKHSPGKSIDFKLTQEKDMRYLSIEDSSDTNFFHGPIWVIELDSIMRLAKRLYPDRFTALASKWALFELGSKANIFKILSLLGSKDVWISILNLFTMLLKVMIKGTFSAVLFPLKIR